MLDVKSLNSEQAAAVKHHQGPMLVVAGAGTGKTQVITTRIAYLIENLKIPPGQILGVTFTEKAAAEMATRVSEQLGRYVLDVNITTFNAFGHELVRRFAYELGMNSNLQLLSEVQQLVFLRQHLDDLKLAYYSPITNSEGLLAELARYFSQLRSELVTVQSYQKYVESLPRNNPAERLEFSRHRELAQAYAIYQQLKRQHNLVDFDDQVGLAVELLATKPNVQSKLHDEIRYLLVDEFQDTNAMQSRLIDLLAGPHANVMVVGDDDQSIYQFRGAAVANILKFRERYPQAKLVSLVQNYRSSQEILDAAYRLIGHNDPDRLEAKYQINKQLRGQFRAEPPRFMSFVTYDEEAQWVSEEIAHKLKQGVSPSEIAILMRKNNQAPILKRYLESAGVSAYVVGETEDLYRQPEVKLLINWLKVVVDPKDTESLYHLLTSELYQVPVGWLRGQVSAARRQHLPLEEWLRTETDNSDEAVLVGQLMDQLDQWRVLLPQTNVGQLAHKFISDSGWLKRLIRAAKADPVAEQPVLRINQFFATLREFIGIADDPSAVGYVNALSTLLGGGERLAVEDLPDLYGEQVRLLTVHKAKGLEFAVVYLFDLTQDTFPARRQSSSLEVPEKLLTAKLTSHHNPQLAEERRLMYVAMTRSKRQLVLTYSADHGGRQARRPSIFIEEALGQQPQLAGLKPKLINTDQIELFKSPVVRARSKHLKTSLPTTMIRGDQLLLTAHQLEDYLNCPAEFFIRHVIAPPQPVSFALEYGNLMHSLIQLYNRRVIDGKPPTEKEMLEYLAADWPKESFVTPGHRDRSLVQAKQSLKAFWRREAKMARHPSFVEHSFEFELADAGVAVRGRFDAVYQGEEVEIRDYKTGGSSVTTKEKADQRAKDSFQLAIYALAWQTLNGQVPGILALDYIDSGLIGRASKTPRQLATVTEKIKRVAAGVRAGNFQPGSSHLFCTHMNYEL
ncbi:ATP-dependent helicase [Candidatus Microgenomates bacterium]|nr:ATP-dependent helicase [Candidatus Microgenomates bacterium]